MKPIIIYESSICKYLNFDGLVLYPFILINTKENETLPSTIKHEITHIRQIYSYGIFNFYFKYGVSIFKNILNGNIENIFISNEFEEEAYNIEMVKLTKKDIELAEWKGYRSDKVHKKLLKLK